MVRKKRKSSKKTNPKLPPMSLKSLESYYRNRGYSPNPLLEDRKDANLTLVKPLPDGRRLHLRIKEGRKYHTIEEHIDRADPKRDPVGHIIGDVIVGGVKHKKYRTPRKKPKKKTKRKKVKK